MKKTLKIMVVCASVLMLAGILVGCSSDTDSATVTDGATTDATKSDTGFSVDGKAADANALQNLKVGQIVTKDGVSVAVTGIADGGKNYEDKPVLRVEVVYTNQGKETATFNSFDWSMQDTNGARGDVEITDATDTLESGELAPGGSKSGALYFLKKDAAKVVYTSNMFDDEEDKIMWSVN